MFLWDRVATLLVSVVVAVSPVTLPACQDTGTGPWLDDAAGGTGAVAKNDAPVHEDPPVHAPADETPPAPAPADAPPDEPAPVAVPVDEEPVTNEPPVDPAPVAEPPSDTEPAPAAPAETTAPPASAAPEDDLPPGVDPALVQLLDQLEASGKSLDAFTADLKFIVVEALEGDRVIRDGTMVYRVDDDRIGKSFAILFDARTVNKRKREDKKHYIFSGRWFAEIDPEEKLFIKREVVAKGERFDPLKLGEGPFPLPIGQSRAEVLERFDVSWAELPENGALAKLRGVVEVDGFTLVPKPETTYAEEVARLDLFYARDTGLPVGIHMIAPNGDDKTVRLDNARRNPVLTAEELARLDIRDPDPTVWKVDIRPLEDQ